MVDLVVKLVKENTIKTSRVAEVMVKVDRKDYYRGTGPYKDRPQEIGYEGRISAPHMHAYALEFCLKHLKPGAKVLDIGCGTGYLCAAFYEFVKDGNKGKVAVVGIEHIKELVMLSELNLRKKYSEELQDGRIKILHADGRQGHRANAPYDVIHVGAASPIVPVALMAQLAVGGVMMIPVGKES